MCFLKLPWRVWLGSKKSENSHAFICQTWPKFWSMLAPWHLSEALSNLGSERWWKEATVQTKTLGFGHWLAAFRVCFQFCHLSGLCLVFDSAFQRCNSLLVSSVRKGTWPGLIGCALARLKVAMDLSALLSNLTLCSKNTIPS